MTAESSPSPRSRSHKIFITIFLLLIVALAAFLRFYHLGEAGVGNQYYAAAVESMLQSWHNFFYVAFEPGGSVTVDKPPLGFWIQCLSASFLGVNGFALALPNALAGVLSVLLLFFLVRRPFGPWAGLLASFALAITPVAISAERNNTIDGLLVFVLLLAAWAVLQSVYTRKVGWLFLGVFFVGLGFNIKMLQAFLPLPGLYALYYFAARHKWWLKMLHLAAATMLLLAVSFSWAVAVDLTPPEERPYVGGSENNTVMELIFGHNGISRLIGGGLNRIRQDAPGGVPGGQGLQPGGQNPPGGRPPLVNTPLPALPGNGVQPGDAPVLQPQGGNGNVMDVGTPGTLRLFSYPLAGEIGWLLPFALGGLVIILLTLGLKRPFTEQHAALILWAGWLLPEAIYFTYSTGIMHAYYMIMMAPPLAALFAITGWSSWQLAGKRKGMALGLLAFLAIVTLLFQAGLLRGQTPAAPWAVGAGVILLFLGLLFALPGRPLGRLLSTGLTFVLIAVLVAPGLWSALTTFNSTPNSGLPYSGPAEAGQQRPYALQQAPAVDEAGVDPRLLSFLLENMDGETYLLATVTANQAAPFILATGLPVFTFGGFGGMDVIVDAEGLAVMVASGELRYVLNTGLEKRTELLQWLQQNCVPITNTGLPMHQARQAPLLDCGGN